MEVDMIMDTTDHQQSLAGLSAEQLLAHVAYMNKPLADPDVRRSFEELRSEFPTQFVELCKVHLSFIIEVPADFLEEGDCHRGLVCSRSTSSLTRWLGLCEQSRVTGAADDLMGGQESLGSHLSVVESLLSMLSAQPPGPDGQGPEGLFRKTGSILRQRRLRDSLAGGWPVDAADFTPHDIAGALKCGLAELPEPLLTRRLLPHFQQLASLRPEPAVRTARQLKGLRLLVQLLPARSRCLLGRLLGLLSSVTRDPGTRMGTEAMGTVFGPLLMYPAACGWDAATACAQAAALNSAAARLVQLGPAVLEIPESFGIDAARTLSRLRVGRQPGGDAVRLSLRFADCPERDPDGFTRAQVAGLYAAVHGMPESGRKRRLIRRFNRCNGGLSPHRLTTRRPPRP